MTGLPSQCLQSVQMHACQSVVSCMLAHLLPGEVRPYKKQRNQMMDAAAWNRASVPMTEASTRTEELRGRPCKVLYSRRKKLNVEEPKPT